MFYVIWIPAIIVVSLAQAWLGVKNSRAHGGWTTYLYLMSFIPTWSLVSKYTTDVLFDGLVYDLVVVACFAGVALVMEGHRLTPTNWVGAAVVIIGLILLKWPA